MINNQPYLAYISSSTDLITHYADTRAGFLEMALEKNRQATPFIAQARSLKVAVSGLSSPSDILSLTTIEAAILAAAGFSDKASRYLDADYKQKAIMEFIVKFLDTAGSGWVDELVYRFLITRGDTIGGSMRNIVGAIAQQKLTRALIASISLNNFSFEWRKTNEWFNGDTQDATIEFQASGLSWINTKGVRTLRYNFSPRFINKNVDLCLLSCRPDQFLQAKEDPNTYILLGELKGGIDPAGADEHWKTARTALARISQAFARYSLSPELVFIGAAIVENMAIEIWEDLENNKLSNVANLTNEMQLAALCSWLIKL